MKILQIHCRYKSGTGGEDTVLEMERALLAENGHCVHQFVASNALLDAGAGGALRTAVQSVWSRKSYREVFELVRDLQPDIVHVHNTFTALSPSVFWAVKRAGLPVVMTLHNYRLVCPNSFLLREDRPCEECIGRLPWPALRYRCRYGESLPAALAIGATQVAHRFLGTYAHKVDAFIALTDFARSLMVRSGLPAERVYVKPNFSPPAAASGGSDRLKQIVFVGRVSRTKGIDLLLSAWASAAADGYRLLILGDGPDKEDLQNHYRDLQNVEWLGSVDRGAVIERMAESRFLVLPSRWYEGFPMVVVEAMSLGTPVILPDHGPFPAIAPERSGASFFSPNDANSLASTLTTDQGMNDADWAERSKLIRDHYLQQYTPETNYRQLIEIYDKVIAASSSAA